MEIQSQCWLHMDLFISPTSLFKSQVLCIFLFCFPNCHLFHKLLSSRLSFKLHVRMMKRVYGCQVILTTNISFSTIFLSVLPLELGGLSLLPIFCPKIWAPFHLQNLRINTSLWLRWERICLQGRRPEFDPWIGKIPWRRA